MFVLLRICYGFIAVVFTAVGLLYVFFAAGFDTPNYADPTFTEMAIPIGFMTVGGLFWYLTFRPVKK